MAKRDQPPQGPPGAPFHAPFAGLAGRLGQLPSGPPASPPGPSGPAPAVVRPGPARAVVRMERAGRRGKTVTVVEQLGLAPRELEAWCGELKRALGSGGAVEGSAIVVQGDVRERVGRWLEGRGVRKVTLG